MSECLYANILRAEGVRGLPCYTALDTVNLACTCHTKKLGW